MTRSFLLFMFPLVLLGRGVCGEAADISSEFDTTTNNGQITIAKYNGSDRSVNIPSKINGLPVTSIGQEAFTSPDLLRVIIPASVDLIGDHAFDGCKILARAIFIGDAPKFGKSVFSKTYEQFKIGYYGGKGFNIITWSNNYGESWPTENLGKLLSKGDNPIGIWSNKAEGFYTVNLGFRKDGKGTLSAGIMTLPTTWKKDGEKILITIVPLPGMGMGGNTTTNAIELTIGDFNTATIGIPSTQTGAKEQKLHLISENEPPDLIAVVEKHQKEQQEKAEAKFIRQTNQITSNQELATNVEKFCTTYTNPPATLDVESSSWGDTKINITEMCDTAFVALSLDASLPEKQELLKYCQFTWSKTEPKSSYPKKVFIDQSAREKIEGFAASNNLTNENSYLTSPIEGTNNTYTSFANITIKGNPRAVATLVKFIVQDALGDKGPFTVIERYPR